MKAYIPNQEMWAGQALLPGITAKTILLLEYQGCTVSELDADLQEPILDKHRENSVPPDYEEYVYEQFADEMTARGFDINVRKSGTFKQNGRTFDRYVPAIYYSGFWSQGDGASFEGNLEDGEKFLNALEAEDFLPEIVKLKAKLDEHYRTLLIDGMSCKVTHSGNYAHSSTMSVDFELDLDDLPVPMGFSDEEINDLANEVTDWMRGLADELYHRLEAEYEGYRTDEAVTEYLEANDWRYYWTGQPFEEEFDPEWDEEE